MHVDWFSRERLLSRYMYIISNVCSFRAAFDRSKSGSFVVTFSNFAHSLLMPARCPASYRRANENSKPVGAKCVFPYVFSPSRIQIMAPKPPHSVTWTSPPPPISTVIKYTDRPYENCRLERKTDWLPGQSRCCEIEQSKHDLLGRMLWWRRRRDQVRLFCGKMLSILTVGYCRVL